MPPEIRGDLWQVAYITALGGIPVFALVKYSIYPTPENPKTLGRVFFACVSKAKCLTSHQTLLVVAHALSRSLRSTASTLFITVIRYFCDIEHSLKVAGR